MGKASDNSTPPDRIHSWAKQHASDKNPSAVDQHTSPQPTTRNTATPSNGTGPSPRPTARDAAPNSGNLDGSSSTDGNGANENQDASARTAARPAPAPPPQHTQNQGEESTAIETKEEPGRSSVVLTWFKEFIFIDLRNAIMHSWINVLLIFVPIGIIVNWAGLPDDSRPTIVFALNAVSIVPLAGLLAYATESCAFSMGDTWASLLNVTFGNAVELIIFIIALVKNEIRIVQASILGSILSNLLLILGMSFLLGGLRFREQIYNSTVTQMSACLLSLSVTSLLLPTAFHASFESTDLADDTTIKISRGVSVVLLIVYVLYLLFQLKSHAYMYESTPQQVIDEESHPGVLAEMMNSSSSSESSSSSDSDSDGSSDSHNTTKKRIKRAFKNRRRRKSAASSIGSPSVVSSKSSPNGEKNVFEEPATPPNGYFDHTRRLRAQGQLEPVFDEDDIEGERERIGGTPRVRDFGNGSHSFHSKSPERKEKKKSKKRFRHSKREKPAATADTQPELNEKEAAPQTSEPQVSFAKDTNQTPSQPPLRRPLYARQFSRPISNLRPALPSLLSNNVFSNPPPQPQPQANTAASGLSIARRSGLRRTSSLPDRLNDQDRNAGNTVTHVNSAPMQNTRLVGFNESDPKTASVTEQLVGDKPPLSRVSAIVLLLITTALVAFCAELLVDAIPDMLAQSNVSQAFIGLIVLPIVGNAAEHVTAVTVAAKNKMDLAIGVAVGSSIQIALFVTPFVVLLGWCLSRDMSLYFNLFETVSLFVTAFVVNFLVLDGRSNYLEGALLIAAYVIIAVCAFFYPNVDQQSQLGGSPFAPAYGQPANTTMF